MSQALFGLAKLLQPSILFFDEIDALLNARGGGSEHESSRKVGTAATAGKETLQRGLWLERSASLSQHSTAS